MEKQRPKIGLGIYVINDKHQVLLMLRGGHNEPGTWSAPGGHLEMGESFLDCAKKELKEEAGMDLKEIEIFPAVNNIFSPEKHYVNIDFFAKGVSGQPQIMEPDKCSKIGWFDLDKLPSPLMLPMTNLFKEYPEIKQKLMESNSFC